MAIVALSVYDALNAIDPRYAEYGGVKAAVAPGTSAAAAAADTALAGLFPSQSAMLAAELAATLSAIPAGRGRDPGIALGTAVAEQVLALRSHDGSDVKIPYVPSNSPGD
jgi:hypothetical protein